MFINTAYQQPQVNVGRFKYMDYESLPDVKKP